ncbi:MAG: hypothetical protein HYW45_02875 [Candidatus Daviesbacteria bacterium]|nr:MAG: hypothetical protein HYW45_02875 [Candidatus Daviesbacteria bacterium]
MFFIEEELRRVGSFGSEGRRLPPTSWAIRAALLLGGTGLLMFGLADVCNSKLEDHINSWQTGMAQRLANDPEHNLLAGEKFYDRVRVIFPTLGANETPFKKRINVRVLPSTHFGVPLPLIEGDNFTIWDTPVVGTVDEGSVVNMVVMGKGWGVAYCTDFQGLVPTNSGKPSPEVCAINDEYIMAVK